MMNFTRKNGVRFRFHHVRGGEPIVWARGLRQGLR